MKKCPKRHKSYIPFFKKCRRFRKATRNWQDPRYVALRKKVLERDGYECVVCHSSYNLEVHHLRGWSSYIPGRYIASNCVLLCLRCHSRFHKLYGKVNNNKSQFMEYRNTYGK